MTDKEVQRRSDLRIPLPPDEVVADLLRMPPPPEKKWRGKREPEKAAKQDR